MKIPFSNSYERNVAVLAVLITLAIIYVFSWLSIVDIMDSRNCTKVEVPPTGTIYTCLNPDEL